jgi:hypothetical protein
LRRGRKQVFIKGIYGWQFFRRTATEPAEFRVVTIWPPNCLLFDFTLELQNDSDNNATLTDAHVLFKCGPRIVNKCELEFGTCRVAPHSSSKLPVSNGIPAEDFKEYDAINSVWFQASVAESKKVLRRRIAKGKLPKRENLQVVI